MVQHSLKNLLSNKAMVKHSFFISIIVVIAIIWLLFLDYIHYICPFRFLFGLWCPGCGGTRMIKSLFHLDFYQAFRYNPLLFILLICGIIYLIINIVLYIKKKALIKPSVKILVFILILLIVYMILRNIPLFSYLIPTEV